MLSECFYGGFGGVIGGISRWIGDSLFAAGDHDGTRVGGGRMAGDERQKDG